MDWRAIRGLELYQKHSQYSQNPIAEAEPGNFEDIANGSLEAQSPPEAIITTASIAWPGKPRPFLVSLDGITCCPSCGQAGRIPHHLSIAFWKFWTRPQLAALIEVMRPDERLDWLAKGLVKVEGADGQSRELREVGGRWDEVPK